jgi:hypothetical protein
MLFCVLLGLEIWLYLAFANGLASGGSSSSSFMDEMSDFF